MNMEYPPYDTEPLPGDTEAFPYDTEQFPAETEPFPGNVPGSMEQFSGNNADVSPYSAEYNSGNVENPVREALERLNRDLDRLVIFRTVLTDPAVWELREAVRDIVNEYVDADAFAVRICAFETQLFEYGDNWSEYLFHLVTENENVCIRKCGREPLSNVLLAALERDLDCLQRFSQVSLDDFRNCQGTDGNALPEGMTGGNILPDGMMDGNGLTDGFSAAGNDLTDGLTAWNISDIDIPGEYRRRMEQVHLTGYGMFAHYHVFTVHDGTLQPVRHPDPQKLADLPGYEREREKIIANTEALLNGEPSNNVLLYGDAGTGKSSTVKALVNEYRQRGLRLVEVKKNQFYELPGLMEQLAENPLKFIVFIDDLSFTVNDDNFAALKAILEGSSGGRAGNAAVYATSNRRHLIKETLSDREGDDIHMADTRQELMSLAARFGLTVTFSNPDRERYLYIVEKLAAQYGVSMGEQERNVRAEAFAIRAGGRSARAARQFIELCKAGVLYS